MKKMIDKVAFATALSLVVPNMALAFDRQAAIERIREKKAKAAAKPVVTNNVQADVDVPTKLVASSCGRGTDKAKPIRNIFFNSKATSSYIADQPVDKLTDIQQLDNSFPVYCSLLISNTSATVKQHVRWAGRLTVVQNVTTANGIVGSNGGEARIISGSVQSGTRIQLNSAQSGFLGLADYGKAKHLATNELNPTDKTWLALAPGEAIHLRFMGLLPRGLTADVIEKNSDSEGWMASQFCSGYVQACDDQATTSDDRGILMVTGNMQYVADSPNNFKIRYATNDQMAANKLGAAEGTGSGRIVAGAPNCFRDKGKDLGYTRIRASLAAEKYHNPSYILTQKLHGGYVTAASEAALSTMEGTGDPLNAENSDYEKSFLKAAEFFASKGQVQQCMFYLKYGTSAYSINAGDCASAQAFVTAMDQKKGVDGWNDIIEDVGAHRFLGANSGLEGQGLDGRCYSMATQEENELSAGNKPLETGQFPQHLAVVPIIVNAGSKF